MGGFFIDFNHKQFADIMVDDVLSKLDGSHSCFERFFSIDRPSRKFILGDLADSSKTNLNKSKSSIKNNSMSIKFLLKDIDDDLIISPSLSVYYKVCPTYEEQLNYVADFCDNDSIEMDAAPIWKRECGDFEEIIVDSFDESYQLDFSEIISKIKEENIFFKKKGLSKGSLESDVQFNKEISSENNKSYFDWDCSISIKKENWKYDGENCNLITISMTNNTDSSTYFETFLFNCNFGVKLGNNEILPFIYEYNEEDNLKQYGSWLRALNCHADYSKSSNIIQTKNFAKFDQKRYVPRTNINGFELTFEDLSNGNCIFSLNKLYDLMLNHLDSCNYSLDDEIYNNSISRFKNYVVRFKNGIELLKNNSNVLRAFQLMNKTFLMNSKGKYFSWRLFQIVFIVSVLPDMVNKSNRDLCDLLHVMTGGGKSETYFGIVLFSAFYDRIMGKSFGVTALTKFPLRMLSIQQLNRIADLFIWAEEIRKEELIPGEPFSIAYFVGNTDEFPRRNSEIKKDIIKADKKDLKLPGVIIEKCPICDGNVYLDYDFSKELIMHRCEKCGKSFGLFFTDEEIFRMIPTFIVSTVDKLAGISQQRRFRNILGGKLDKCPKGHGFIPRGDICEADYRQCKEKGIPIDIDFDVGPSLIIQDEMHLIKEGFGTIDSHFESLLEAMHNEFSGSKFKNISMSATVNGAKNQIQHLYHKNIDVFPTKLENLYGEDFFFEELNKNNVPIYQRQIIGLKPNLRDNNYAIILTMRYISEFIKDVFNNIEIFADELNVSSKVLIENINLYRNFLSYHNKKADVHTLNFFTHNLINESKTFNAFKVDPIILTGDNSLDEIKKVISRVSEFPASESSEEKLLLTSSTNIVSHGVDIDNWNVMFFQGIPRNTSEYIQALSRVGRKYFGIIFLWFYPNRVRDISFYQNFNEYHNILEYKVENVPLSRWAKLGFKQTFTSVFDAAVINFISDKLEIPIYDVDTFNKVFENEYNKELLIDFIKKAYISSSEMLGSRYFDENIRNETLNRINYLKNYSGAHKSFFPKALADNDYMYYKVQLGMRGIQDNILLSPFWGDLQYLSKRGD